MIAAKQAYRFQRAALDLVPPARRLAESFRDGADQQQPITRQDYSLDAIRREMDCRTSNIGQTRSRYRVAQGPKTGLWHDRPRPVTDEDIRIHAGLNERLRILHRERYGWWAKARRLLGL